ncbi:heat-inducible transcription repressor HrcA [Peptoclostridium litorale DSM 5388]|uniref:Heat-inducible transcription repressor HrcA n=1 Tax=Peptoclostridium litorale DSM 5388 TaxID=1121324 RepID=A0A069RDD9_PEPLI|nr:heat-inducible transcriptional repressor HrcA [Peptoclostridium litorale]KDR95056.1 heat-inducible transcription repressor HrcA [Peptoclostridium litorale DSM 5388]SIN75732.1 heat-inducible transcription repressor HrcA [Peptoclostridium litorale DSM 5388]
MDLTDRKMKILEAIIREYIFVAEPLGSRTLSKRHDLGISAATIRNEMSDLEDMGYLMQPHTSSGRIPTQEGYRLYVENMMQKNRIDKEQMKMIDDSLRGYGELQNILDEALRLMSSFTRYTSIAVTPKMKESILKNIQLVQVNQNTVLVILVMDNGLIRNLTINTRTMVCQDKLSIISKILNEKLSGKSIRDMDSSFASYLKNQIHEYSALIDEVFELMHSNMLTLEDSQILSDGITNIFQFPEFSDISKAKAFLDMMSEKRPVMDMLNSEGIVKGNINIVIGNKNTCEIAKECSLLTATYTLNGKTIGKIGIIGPTRMNYSKVFSIMSYISNGLNDFIENNF